MQLPPKHIHMSLLEEGESIRLWGEWLRIYQQPQGKAVSGCLIGELLGNHTDGTTRGRIMRLEKVVKNLEGTGGVWTESDKLKNKRDSDIK